MDTIEKLSQRRKENRERINCLKAELRAIVDDPLKVKSLRQQIENLYCENKALRSEIAYEKCMEREFGSLPANLD